MRRDLYNVLSTGSASRAAGSRSPQVEGGGPAQVAVSVVYLTGVVALCVALGLVAGDVWVGVVCFVGLAALHVNLARAVAGEVSGVFFVSWFGAWMVSSAGTMAEYDGRWLWAIPWVLAGLVLIATGGAVKGKPSSMWASQGSLVLGLWSLAWAIVGPLWLHGKSQAEAGDWLRGALTDWWWIWLIVVVVVVGGGVLIAYAQTVAERTQQLTRSRPDDQASREMSDSEIEALLEEWKADREGH